MDLFDSENLLIVYGGREEMRSRALSDIYVLNLENLMWFSVSLKFLSNIQRCLHSTALVGNQLHIFGGIDLQ